MIGSASIISPKVAGMVSSRAKRIPRASSLRNAVKFPNAAIRASKGSATVPRATPKIPKGSCMTRNAWDSQ